MLPGKRKGIIFASTIEDIKSAIEFVKSVYPDITIKFVHSKQPESHNEEAGQHYTPREVIELMVNLIFEDEEDLADSSKIKTVYDGACGTGGMLSTTNDYIKRLNVSARVELFGQ